MKTISAELLALLNSKAPLYYVDLYTLTLANGGIYRYTAGDRAVTYGADTWVVGPLFYRSLTSIVSGIEVSTMTVDVTNSQSGITLAGLPLVQFVASGGMDGATIKVERGFAASPNDINLVGKIVMYLGRVAEVSTERTFASLKLKSPTELLDTKVPANLYQPGCDNTLYDGGCGLDPSAFAAVGTVVAGTTKSLIKTDLVDPPADRYSLGVLRWISGNNAGLTYTIKKQNGSDILLINPVVAMPQVGDQFSVSAGCDKTRMRCLTVFNNLNRFRGQPFIPVPETIA